MPSRKPWSWTLANFDTDRRPCQFDFRSLEYHEVLLSAAESLTLSDLVDNLLPSKQHTEAVKSAETHELQVSDIETRQPDSELIQHVDSLADTAKNMSDGVIEHETSKASELFGCLKEFKARQCADVRLFAAEDTFISIHM